MKPIEFMRDRLGQIFIYIFLVAALSMFLYLTGTALGVLILILSVWIPGAVMVMFLKYRKESLRLKELESIMEGLDKKYLFAECVQPVNVYEGRMFQLMRRSGKGMIEAVSDAQKEQKEYREYIEDWVHEIKAPITATQLICNNNKSELSRKLLPQLAQIEGHVERALYYARAGSVEKDFMIRKTLLSGIVKDAITRHQTLLIQNGVKLETFGLETSGLDTSKNDVMVYTDGKWVTFMIGQLLSNAIRYRVENPVIRIEAHNYGKQIRLCVTDNGIGIPANELPRIFERGFTGSNGRKRGGSTGMGLYICRKLADFLQITMDAETVQNEYTSISMIFPAKENLTKM